MKKVTFFDYPIIWTTYSSYEYDRVNGDLPTLLLKFNAKDFGGEYMYQLNKVYNELNVYKNTEMKEAFVTSQMYKGDNHRLVRLIKK